MPHRIQVRAAESSDIPAMLKLMQPYMDDGTLLPRNEDDLCQHLQEFIVAWYDHQLAGIAALHIYTPQLAEVRSLVVDASCRKHGIGLLLVKACEQVAAQHGITRVFALTYVQDFFTHMGYRVVAKESLPHKIWTVCIHCEKFSRCDETAVEKILRNTSQHPPPILERYEP